MDFIKKYHSWFFPVFFFLIFWLLDKVFNIESLILKGIISGAMGFLLSPRKKKIETQKGTKIQLTWLFLKKAIFIDD